MQQDADAAAAEEVTVAADEVTDTDVGDVSEANTAEACTSQSEDGARVVAGLTRWRWMRISPVRAALIFGAAAVVALAAVVGWSTYRMLDLQRGVEQDATYVQVARQTATNLTTIDWRHPEDDVQRILDSATGGFRDEFQQRAPAFIELVKKTKSITTGRVTEAGIESESDTEAQVLVTVSVTTTSEGNADQQPRAWRMRVAVDKSAEDSQVTNVAFVP